MMRMMMIIITMLWRSFDDYQNCNHENHDFLHNDDYHDSTGADDPSQTLARETRRAWPSSTTSMEMVRIIIMIEDDDE